MRTARAGILGVLLVATPVAGAVTSAEASLPSEQPSAPASCAPMGRPGPGYNASIGNPQNGKRVCITVGEKLLVLLSAPPTGGSDWQRIEVSPSGILMVTPLRLMLSRNLTATDFMAARQGVVQLSSQRPACSRPPKSQTMCGAVVSWEAIVVVRGAQKDRY